jgi:hypothetical protein
LEGFSVNRSIRLGLTGAVTAAALVFGGMAPANAQLRYPNCTALHKDFKHGVAKSRKAAMRQVRQGYGRPAFGRHARHVYWANYTRLDRDRDGTACEA